NFFSRLLFITNHGCFIDKCLTKRRVHVNSIQQQLKINNKEKLNQLFISEWFLLNAVQDKLSKSLVRRSLKRLVRFSYETQKLFHFSFKQWKVLFKLLKMGFIKETFLFFSWIIFNLVFGRGYFFIKRIYYALR